MDEGNELGPEEFSARFPYNEEDTPVSLRCICRKEGGKYCLALIGKAKFRICMATVMRGKKSCPRHRAESTPKYQFEEEEELHIPSKAVGGQPAVYTRPMIGRVKILPEHLDSVLRDARPTARWVADLPRYAEAQVSDWT